MTIRQRVFVDQQVLTAQQVNDNLRDITVCDTVGELSSVDSGIYAVFCLADRTLYTRAANSTWVAQTAGRVLARATVSGAGGFSGGFLALAGRPQVTTTAGRRLLLSPALTFYNPNAGSTTVHIERWTTGATPAIQTQFGRRDLRSGVSPADIQNYAGTWDDVPGAGTWEYRIAVTSSSGTASYTIDNNAYTNSLIVTDAGPV